MQLSKAMLPVIKNPTSGIIKVQSVGAIIRDENTKAPDNCVIEEGYNG